MAALKKFALAVLLMFAFAAPTFADDDGFDWRLVRQQGNIEIYKSPVEGSSIKAVKAVTRMQGSLVRLATLLRDPALRPAWDVNCGDIHIVDQVSDMEELVYLHVKLPWPIKDRDMVSRNMWQLDEKAGHLSMNGAILADDTPPVGRRVRVTEGFNTWDVQRGADGALAVTTIAHLDPAGPLPSWIINMLSEEAPVDMLQKLTKLMAAPE